MININLLPKNLRRRREPGYWRLIALAFPLLVLAVIASLQFLAMQTVARLEGEQLALQDQLRDLQPFLQRQAELQRQQRQLGELIAIRDGVQQGRIVWSNEIYAMLETLPAANADERPRVAFTQLSLQGLDEGARQQRLGDSSYDGQDAFAEMSIQGTARNTEVLAAYLRALETSPLFGVTFQSASRDEQTALYQFSMTVGVLSGGHGESSSQ